MTGKETIIDGYRVEMEPNADRPDAMDCFISIGRYSASLSALEDNGVLTDLDAEKPVPAATIDRITQWATDNGY